MCRVINTRNENGQSDDDDYFLLSVKTIYDENELGTKNFVKIRLGWYMIVNLKNLVDSASPIRFIEQNVLHEIKLEISQPEGFVSGEKE